MSSSRVGRRINSAALIADGYHARTDGLTSLAVVVRARHRRGLRFPRRSNYRLVITVAIFGIVWQSRPAPVLAECWMAWSRRQSMKSMTPRPM